MNRKILSLAIPSIVANITTPLLGLVDATITGHMGGAVYIGAVAVGGVMFSMLYWLFSFLRAGTSGLAAQACGSTDLHVSSLVLWRSLFVALGLGVLIVALQWPIRLLLTWFLQPDPATKQLACRYFAILVYGAPAVLGTYALSGWFLGMQNSRMLMVTSIVINIVNIVVSICLVYVFHLKIEGVAIGTLVAQWSGFVTALLLLLRYRVGHVAVREIFDRDELMRFFSINIDVMLRTICLIAVTVWFTKLGARQGAVILAVNSLLMQLFFLFSYMMDGFAFAAEALVGKFVGANDFQSLRSCVTRIFVWGALLALVFTAIYFFGGESFLAVLTDDHDVVLASAEYAMWAVTIPLTGFAAFAWDGVFIGATLTRQLLWSMFGATCVFFGLCYCLLPLWGNHALWLAFVSYLLMRGVIQTFLFRKFSKNHHK